MRLYLKSIRMARATHFIIDASMLFFIIFAVFQPFCNQYHLLLWFAIINLLPRIRTELYHHSMLEKESKNFSSSKKIIKYIPQVSGEIYIDAGFALRVFQCEQPNKCSKSHLNSADISPKPLHVSIPVSTVNEMSLENE